MRKLFVRLFFSLCALYGQASATQDEINPVAGRPHAVQYAYFNDLREGETPRLIGVPCVMCTGGKTSPYKDLVTCVELAQDKEGLQCQGEGDAPYCCDGVARQAALLRVARLSPEIHGYLNALVKVHAPFDKTHVRMPNIVKVLLPILETPAWDQPHTVGPREKVFFRAVHESFFQCFRDALLTHPNLKKLSFVSKEFHPFFVPMLESFIKNGSGPSSLSFHSGDVCDCPGAFTSARLNAYFRIMPFLTHMTFEDSTLDHRKKTFNAPFLSMCLEGTSVTHLTLRKRHANPRHDLVVGGALFQKHEDELFEKQSDKTLRGLTRLGFFSLALCQDSCQILKNSALQRLTLHNPYQDEDLMASPFFGDFLKESRTLRTLVLSGKAYIQGGRAENARVFVRNVLSSRSLTNIHFKGGDAHKSFGLSDEDKEVLEAHFAQKRKNNGKAPAMPLSCSTSFRNQTNPVAGHPHAVQYAYFNTLREEMIERFGELPCVQCNADTYSTHADSMRRGGRYALVNCAYRTSIDGYMTASVDVKGDKEGLQCHGGGDGLYCCDAVARQAALLKVAHLSPEVHAYLDVLAKVYVPHSVSHLRLPNPIKALSPLVEGLSAWNKPSTMGARERIFLRAVFGYFSSALVGELTVHPTLKDLTFVSKGIHPLLIPSLEAFATKGSGLSHVSFGPNHLCKCPKKGVHASLNASLRRMPFLTHVTLDAHMLGFMDPSPLRLQAFSLPPEGMGVTHPPLPYSATLSALLDETSVSHLALRKNQKIPRDYLVRGHDLFHAHEDDLFRAQSDIVESSKLKADGACVGLSQKSCHVLENSALHTLILHSPSTSVPLMASPSFGDFLKKSHALRTLVLRGEGYGYGNTKVFVDSVLGSASLTNVLFEGEEMHKSFGLSDGDREVIEAHLAQNRVRGERHAASFS